jgi:hypothetical protein
MEALELKKLIEETSKIKNVEVFHIKIDWNKTIVKIYINNSSVLNNESK